MTRYSRTSSYARGRCGKAVTFAAAGAVIAPVAFAMPASAETAASADPGASVIATDAFGRTATHGWGRADSGATWVPNYQAATFSVASGQGRMQTGTPGATCEAFLPGTSADVLTRADISV